MDYKFSVLMSVYIKEKAEYLDLALKSITDDQILKPNQIVLVKDGPITHELELIINKYVNKYKNLFKVISLEKNFGLGKALNIGLKNCDYELVARMDGDDISKSERFKEQIKLFKLNKKIDVVGSWIEEFYFIESEKKIRGIRKVLQEDIEIKNQLKKNSPMNHATVMYKKSKVIEAGNYLSTYKLEDYYLWYRMNKINAKFYNIQKNLLDVRFDYLTAKRRGGIILLKDDIRFFKKMLDDKFITKIQFINNSIKWSIYRLLPSNLREVIQRKILR